MTLVEIISKEVERVPIVNCKRCGKIFRKTAGDLCAECIKEEGEILETIRAYLKQNPLSSLAEVSDATDVSVEDITDLIQAGMLRLTDFPHMSVECQGCGTPIQQGRYCSRCKELLRTKLADAAKVLKQPTKERESKNKGFYSL